LSRPALLVRVTVGVLRVAAFASPGVRCPVSRRPRWTSGRGQVPRAGGRGGRPADHTGTQPNTGPTGRRYPVRGRRLIRVGWGACAADGM